MVLVSCVVPVNAVSVQALSIWKYYIGSESSDTDVLLKFELGDIPTQYIGVNADTGVSKAGFGSLILDIPHDSSVYNVYAWPLGTVNWYNQPAIDGLIDLADFDSFIQFDLETYYEIDIECSTEIWGSSRTFPFQAYYQVQYYDESGGYLGYHMSDVESRSALINNGTTSFNFNFQSTLYLQPPADASYFCYFTKMMFPSNFSDDGWLHQISVSSDRLRINCTVDSLTQDVVSSIFANQKLDGINDQLGDLNDKADQTNQQLGDLNDKADQTNQQLGDLNDKTDTLINGTPGMQNRVDDYNGSFQDAGEEIDEFTEWESGLFQDFQNTLDEAKASLEKFLDGIGWFYLGQMIKPILNWGPISYAMLMLVAFVNLSVILFGR